MNSRKQIKEARAIGYDGGIITIDPRMETFRDPETIRETFGFSGRLYHLIESNLVGWGQWQAVVEDDFRRHYLVTFYQK